jgi:hypothetical protein
MRLEHWFHAFLVNHWNAIMDEHFRALNTSGLANHLSHMYVGAVGNELERWRLRQRLSGPVSVVAEAEVGAEQVTLTALWEAAKIHPDPDHTAVLYCHTKGVSDGHQASHDVDPEFQNRWRREMTEAVVGRWQEAVDMLETHDIVGVRWHDEPFKHFQGNFHWSRMDWLRQLPAPTMWSRWEGEKFVGNGEPRVGRLDA